MIPLISNDKLQPNKIRLDTTLWKSHTAVRMSPDDVLYPVETYVSDTSVTFYTPATRVIHQEYVWIVGINCRSITECQKWNQWFAVYHITLFEPLPLRSSGGTVVHDIFLEINRNT